MLRSHLLIALMIAGWVLAVFFAGLAWRYWSRIGLFRVKAECLQLALDSRVTLLRLAKKAQQGTGAGDDDDDPFGVEDPTVPDARRK